MDNRYVSPDTWYDAQRQALSAGRPLLRRRRDEALRRRALPAPQGGLRRAPASRRHLAGLADLLRGARAVLHARRAALPRARRARRGPDRASGERAVSAPGRVARAADPAARRRPRGAGHQPFHAPCGIMLDESNPPFSTCIRCATCDGFPCLVHAKSDAEVLGVRPALEHANVTLLTNAKVVRLDTNGEGTAVTEVVVERDGGEERFAGGRRRRRLRRGQHGQAAPAVGEREAPERPRQWLRPGRPQLHVPRLDGRARALARGEPDRLPEDARAQRLLLRLGRLRVPARQRPDGRQVDGADVPRRAAAGYEARARVDAGADGAPCDRLLALDRGPATARQPGHRRRRGQADAHLRGDEPGGQEAALREGQVDARASST